MKKRTIKKFVPAAWQMDPASLKAANVQFWLASGTMSGVISLTSACSIVAEGRAYVVNDQAISQL